jgi:hypothetical protein
MKRPRLSPDEVEQMMIPKLVEAIYPVLIPMEQQDMAIQAANQRKVETASAAAWRAFSGSEIGRGNDEKVLEAIALATQAERDRCIQVLKTARTGGVEAIDVLIAMLGGPSDQLRSNAHGIGPDTDGGPNPNYTGRVAVQKTPEIVAQDMRELCAKVAEQQARDFLSTEYAANQPLGSFCERFACEQVAKAIRAMPDGLFVIATELSPQGSGK